MGLKISTNKSQRAEMKSKKKLEMLQFLIKRLIVLAFDQRQIPESIKDAISLPRVLNLTMIVKTMQFSWYFFTFVNTVLRSVNIRTMLTRGEFLT